MPPIPPEQIWCLDAVNCVCRNLPEVLVCEPVRIGSRWLPAFFAVENRPRITRPGESAEYVVSVVETHEVIVPFLLVRTSNTIYDWWLHIWGPGGSEILEGLINTDEVPLFVISPPAGIVNVYPLPNNWRPVIQAVREKVKNRKPWTPGDTAGVKYSIMLRFRTKLDFWNRVVASTPHRT